MKDLSIEEKAKRYDEIIKKANKMHNENCEVCKACLEELIPELAESEDERVRKALITYFSDEDESYDGIPYPSIRAWLERQCEQNPYSGVSFKYNGHAWGMCARDGGVEILMDGNLKAFISLDKSFIYPISSQSALEAVKEEKVDNQNCAKPADKVKPKFKVGDKIKLAKESTYPAREIIAIKNDAYYFDKLVHLPFCYQDEWELVEQKSTWNKEDEETALGIEQLCNCASLLNISPDKINKVKQWLKSIKERVQPQNHWRPSEEQMNALNDVISSRDIKYDVLSELWKDLKKLKEE